MSNTVFYCSKKYFSFSQLLSSDCFLICARFEKTNLNHDNPNHVVIQATLTVFGMFQIARLHK